MGLYVDRKVGIPYGMIQRLYKMDVTCDALVFEVGTAQGSFEYRFTINITYWFLEGVIGNGPSMYIAINLSASLTRKSVW